MEKSETRELKKVVSFWDLFFIAVGQIIGAGIIALTGVAIGMTGPGVVFAYIFAAFLVVALNALLMMAGSAILSDGKVKSCNVERVKKSYDHLDSMYKHRPPKQAPGKYLVFKRWDTLEEQVDPQMVFFFGQ